MREITEDRIKNMLSKDYVGRNQQLASLINVINNNPSDTSPVVALNSPWGSGKTVFVKQLNMLNIDNNLEHPGINNATVKDFQDKYATYYFNAWEHDYIADPLEAVLLSLINDMQSATDGLQASAAKKTLSVIDPSEYIKNRTDGLINLKKLSEPSDLIQEAGKQAKRKEEISNIIRDYIQYRGKRLVFIIDELDRCKPSFAVNLLEIMKHYFADLNIVFIFSVDTVQLSHTVKKYYGNDFDGAAYLDRFFDFTMSLQAPDKEKFIREYLRVPNDSYFINNVPSYIADYLDFSLRETEHYISSLEFVAGYMTDTHRFGGGQTQLLRWFAQFVFTPLVLALKIKNQQTAAELANGSGREIITHMIKNSNGMAGAARWQLSWQADQHGIDEVAEEVVKLYDKLFDSAFDQREYDIERIKDSALSATNLIGKYATVKEIESGETQ